MCIWERANKLLTSMLVKRTLSFKQILWHTLTKRPSVSTRLHFCPAYLNVSGLLRTKESRRILTGIIITQNLCLFYKSVSSQPTFGPRILSSALDVFSNGLTSWFWSSLLTLINWRFKWLSFTKNDNAKTICSVPCMNIYNIQLSNKANSEKLGPNSSKWLPVSRPC